MGKKQFLNSMYKRGVSSYDPVTRRYIPMSNDALIYTEKDIETLETTIKIIPHPNIDFYVAANHQKFHRFNIRDDEVIKKTVPYADREKQIAMMLGCLDSYFNSKRNGSSWEYNKSIMRHPDLYSADTDIEDFYKTKSILENGVEAIAPSYKMAFSDTEVDISRFDEDFPDPKVAPCPICLITAIYATEMKIFSYILFDPRTKDDIAWVANNPTEFVEQYLDKQIVDEGFKFNFKVFENEADLIIEYFKDIHIYKPDFMAWWNMSFDMPTIINRLSRLGYDDKAIANIMCHPDIPEQYRFYKYIDDPKRRQFDNNNRTITTSSEEDISDDVVARQEGVDGNGGDEEADLEDGATDYDGRSKNSKAKPHPSRYIDWVNIPGYTQHYCQTSMFSNLRKRYLYPSYKLDDIGKEFAGIGKYDLKANGYNIKTADIKNFKIFLAYNIRDSFVQYMLEKKQHDMNQYVISASNTRLSKGHQMSIVIKNEACLYLLNRHEHIGNAIDYNIMDKLPGAIVGRGELIEQLGVNVAGLPCYIFECLIDCDASSLYPSIMIACNIFKSTLYGHIVEVYKKSSNYNFGKADGLFAQIATIDQSLFDICEKYMDLPGPATILAQLADTVNTKLGIEDYSD